MTTKKKRPSPVGQTPWGSASRLVVCPICQRSVHLLLATAHVEAHFVEGDRPDGGEEAHGMAQAAAAVEANENVARTPNLLSTRSVDGGPADCAENNAEEDGADDVPCGGALCGGGGADGYAPGTDAVWRSFRLQVMSGDSDACGLCYERFEPGARDRFVLWPCQHTRQCGPCALRIWQTPKAKRRCPWCAAKLDTRPRAFRPFM